MSKSIYVDGLIYSPNTLGQTRFNVIVSNDTIGQTLSINDGVTQFTIPFEPVLEAMVAEGVKSQKLEKVMTKEQRKQSGQHHGKRKKKGGKR